MKVAKFQSVKYQASSKRFLLLECLPRCLYSGGSHFPSRIVPADRASAWAVVHRQNYIIFSSCANCMWSESCGLFAVWMVFCVGLSVLWWRRCAMAESSVVQVFYLSTIRRRKRTATQNSFVAVATGTEQKERHGTLGWQEAEVARAG